MADELCEIDEVLEVYEVMGASSYFVKIAAENNEDAQSINLSSPHVRHRAKQSEGLDLGKPVLEAFCIGEERVDRGPGRSIRPHEHGEITQQNQGKDPRRQAGDAGVQK